MEPFEIITVDTPVVACDGGGEAVIRASSSTSPPPARSSAPIARACSCAAARARAQARARRHRSRERAPPRLPGRRLGLHLPGLSRAAAADAGRRHAGRRGAGLLQHAAEAAAGAPTPITSRWCSTPPTRASATASTTSTRRTAPTPPDDLVPQFALVREATDAFNVCRIERDGLRGRRSDRRLCHAAPPQAGATVTIVSSDKDLMQLVSDRVEHARPDEGQADRRGRGAGEVRRRPGQGDRRAGACAATASTTCRACPGIGVKTAAELINAYGDLENLLAARGRDQAAQAPPVADRLRRAGAHLAAASSRSTTTRRCRCRSRTLAVRPLDRGKARRLPDRRRDSARSWRGSTRAGPGAASSRQPRAPAANAAHRAARRSPRPTLAPRRAALRANSGHRRRSSAGSRRRRPAARSRSTPRPTSLDSVAGRAGRRVAGARRRATPATSRWAIARPSGELRRRRCGRSRATRRSPRLKPLLEDESVLKIGQNIKYDIAVLRRRRHRGRADRLHHADVVRARRRRCTATGSTSWRSCISATTPSSTRTSPAAARTMSASPRCRWSARATMPPRTPTSRCACTGACKPRLIARAHARLLRDGGAAARCRWWRRWSAPASRVDRAELARLSADFAGRIAGFEARDPQPRRASLQRRLAQAAGRGAVRRAGTAGRQEGQDRRLRHRRRRARATGADARRCRRACSTGASSPSSRAPMPTRWSSRSIPRTGRVHTSYALAGASTGRLASTDPNLQNIPIRTEEGRKIRRAFVAAPGHRADLGRLQPDRAAPRRARRRCRAAEATPSAPAPTFTR